MFIPTNENYDILRYIQQEGCLLIKEDKIGTHPELGIKNLKVMSVATSLTSRGYLKRIFVWRHAYYTVTFEGAQKLRQDLCIEGDLLQEDEIYKEEDVEITVEE